MLKSLRWIALPLVLVLALPVFGADEKKDKKKKDEDGEPKAKAEKLQYGATFRAMVTKVSQASEKEFTVQISYQYLDQVALANYQRNLATQQQRAMMIRNPLQRQQALAQAMNQRPPGNLVQTKKMDVDLRANDDIKVRSLQPPIDYDDKGNVKKYTKKELAELKGPDKSLPGYTRDYESLQSNQYVKVYLAKEKPGAKKKAAKKPKKGKKEKKEDADDDDGLEDESKPLAVMVVIEREPRARDEK
jgi:hypothetical protein